MDIYLDFDGTVVEHAFPKIGRAVPHAMRVIKRLYDAGHSIILNTMRVEIDDLSLQKAHRYIEQHPEYEISLSGTTKEKIYPNWQPQSKDIIFIDDSAIDTPLIPAIYDGVKMVDWLEVEKILDQNDVFQIIKT